jgi:hypothetical protein
VAYGTATRTREASPVAKDEATVLANGRIKNEASRLVACKGFHDVGEVILHLSFWNSQQLGELVGRESSSGNQFDDALTRSSF